jgi:hypothetical protein
MAYDSTSHPFKDIMISRVTRISFEGEVPHRHEADVLLRCPGSVVLVNRVLPRSLVMACPDGCGETLTINLDDRAGPAWRFYRGNGGITLFPSVWRESGCRSHFILWRSKLYWCDGEDEAQSDDFVDASLRNRVDRLLSAQPASYLQLADKLGEIPWAVLAVCRELVKLGRVSEGFGKERGLFRLRR